MKNNIHKIMGKVFPKIGVQSTGSHQESQFCLVPSVWKENNCSDSMIGSMQPHF